ncbi:MAG: outer membrane beta-barrel protein [Planctomycetia bacterium]|nr:outer membrane beta-barrel protein [Planctomycetia bacterium]
MSKLPFQWKTILKGFIVLLTLSVGAQLHAQTQSGYYSHDAYLTSFDAGNPKVVAASYQNTNVVPSQQDTSAVPCETCIVSETAPEGLFLHKLNNSSGYGFFIEGYIDQGLTYGSSEDYQTPAAMNDKEGYQMNQLYLSLGRKVVKGNHFSVGAQIDIMFGTDYYYMSSAGLENHSDNSNHWNSMSDDYNYRAGRSEYGVALPQFYAEFYAPFMEGLDVKVGHFYSVMGYESMRSDQNFFYSRTYSKMYGMPTSMTGVIAEQGLGCGWNLVYGAVNEWNAFDTPNDTFSGVLGANYTNYNGFFTFAVTTMFGDQHAPCYQYETYSDDAEMCFVLNTYAKFQLSQRLSYVCEFTVGYDDREYFCMETFENNHGRAWFGLTNYLFYDICDDLTLGFRFEWFNDSDNTVIDGGYGWASIDDSVNYFAFTFGANWTPLSWLSIRPEIRYDFSDYECAGMETYNNWSSDYQLTVGADMIIRF